MSNIIHTAYPPPPGIHLESANKDHLIFTWNHIAPECAAIRYTIISADECGICPDTTAHNSASCNHFQASANGNLCSFALQSEFCPGHVHRTIGNMSDPIRVTLKGELYIDIVLLIIIHASDITFCSSRASSS